jgi:hypothetical protein
MKMRDLITPQQDERYNRTIKRGDTPCQLCGRPLQGYGSHHAIENAKTGDLIPVGEPYDENADSWLHLGPECAKREELRGYVYANEAN